MTSLNLIHKDLSYRVTGILFAVHNELGRYRNERQYGDRVEYYLKLYHIPHQREVKLPPSFDGERAGRNKLDFLIEDKIVLELKAKSFITKEDYFQARRYLASLKKKLAIVANFRDKYLRPKRVLNSAVFS